MSYSFIRNGNILNIEFSGQIDLSITNIIKSEFEEIISKDFINVMLSAKNLEYIDSSGVATLLMIKRRCGQLGCELVISDISEAGYRVIELAKLNGLLPIEKVVPQEELIKKDGFEFSESIFNVDKIVDLKNTKSQDVSENSPNLPNFKPGSFL